jgi:hypothetical protein
MRRILALADFLTSPLIPPRLHRRKPLLACLHQRDHLSVEPPSEQHNARHLLPHAGCSAPLRYALQRALEPGEIVERCSHGLIALGVHNCQTANVECTADTEQGAVCLVRQFREHGVGYFAERLTCALPRGFFASIPECEDAQCEFVGGLDDFPIAARCGARLASLVRLLSRSHASP